MSESDSEELDEEPIGHKMRRAFYDGIARECLDLAWQRLDEFRGKQVVKRTFRGRLQERPGMPLQEIAERINRNVGELSRWFSGQSPAWGNLSIVMTALSADWPDLQSLPDKKSRRIAGCIAALVVIRRYSNLEPAKPPSTQTINSLTALAEQADWSKSRCIPDRIPAVYAQASKASGISIRDLEAADRDWGYCFLRWLNEYLASLEECIWQ